jgi:NAD(P)-dependent dehydrogenase (short-subunit alcohol dehydrogenase family)/acyl carrier protein
VNALSYFAVDFAQLIERRPDVAARTLAEVTRMAADGRIEPLPYSLYPAGSWDEAFALLKRSGHIGKLVIDTAQLPDPAPRPRHVAFDPDGAYLVTGGTAGFGAATARWLADHGAGHVVVTGRRSRAERDPTPRVTAMAADVTDPEAMAAVIRHAASRAPHGLKGVFHCAAHYDDAPLQELGTERFAAVLAPKVSGAILLDELTGECDLDHFVLYSSVASLLGNRLQSAYGAANLCLEALARERRRRGLPAVAVGWGAIADTGVVTRTGMADALSGLGLEPATPGEALHALGELLTGTPPENVVIARADWHRLGVMFPACAGARFSRLTGRHGGQPALSPASLRDRLYAATPAQARELATEAVTTVVAGVMRISPERLDTSTSLGHLGVDSLLATELAVTLRQNLGVDIPTLEILSSRGISDLGGHLLSAFGVHRAREGVRS